MRHVPTVAARELRSLFVSPVAYVVLSLFAVLAGLFFVLGVAAFDTWVRQLMQFQAFDQLQELNLNDQLIASFYDTMSVILLILTPAVTMGLFAAEKTNGTQELLLTSPLTIWDIVHPDAFDHCRQMFGQVLQGQSLEHVEARFVAKDGTSVTWKLRPRELRVG